MKYIILLVAICQFSCKKTEPVKMDSIAVRMFSSEYNYSITIKGKSKDLDKVSKDARTETYYFNEFNSKDLRGIMVTVKPKEYPNTTRYQVNIEISVNGVTVQSVRSFYPSGAIVYLNHSINGGVVNF